MIKSKHLSSKDYDVSAKSSHSHMLGEDRISKLPLSLRHHILSKAPSEDAMRTMVLSKAWKDVWLTSPCLDLAKEMWDRFSADVELRIKFLDFAFRILKRRNDLNCSSIERLHLFLPGPPETRRGRREKQGDKLLCYAVTKFVIHELKLSSYSKTPKYELSKTIIQHAHSLTFLSLKCLILDQQTISILSVKCPLLKFLKLKYCVFGDPKVSVSGFHKLDNLSVIATTSESDDVKVEIIDAPSLVKFRYFGLSASRANSPSIDVILDSACEGLKHMDLRDVWIDRNSLNRVLSHLPNLQHLKLSCYFLCHRRLDIHGLNLKHLELKFDNSLEQLHIDAPILTDFVYTFFAWDFDPMPIIIPSNAAAFNPEKVTINIESSNERLGNMLQNVHFKQFVRQLEVASQHLTARIYIFHQDTLPYLRELRASIYDFKHLVLFYEDRDLFSWPPEPATSQVLFTTLIDPALCLFPNLQTCIILQHNSKWELTELKLEFKYKGSEVNGCWQQRLREVKIENIRGSKKYLSTLNTHFEEAIKANKIVVQC